MMVISWFEALSVKHKLILIITLTSTVTVLLAIVISAFSTIYNIKKDTVSEITALANIIGNNSTAALAFNDNSLARANLGALESNIHVRQGCLYTASRNLFASYSKTSEQIHCSDLPQEGASYRSGDSVGVMAPVLENGTLLGFIFVRSDLKKIDEYISQQFTFGLMAILLTIFAVAYPLAFFLQKSISLPIGRLVRDITSTPALRMQDGLVSPNSQDELIYLHKFLQLVAQRIQNAENQLALYKQQSLTLHKNNQMIVNFLEFETDELRAECRVGMECAANELYGELDVGYVEKFAEQSIQSATLSAITKNIKVLHQDQKQFMDEPPEELEVNECIKQAQRDIYDKSLPQPFIVFDEVKQANATIITLPTPFRMLMEQVLLFFIVGMSEQKEHMIRVHAYDNEADGMVINFQFSIVETGGGGPSLDGEGSFIDFNEAINREGLFLLKFFVNYLHGNMDVKAYADRVLLQITFPKQVGNLTHHVQQNILDKS